jgi:hypothetical protein
VDQFDKLKAPSFFIPEMDTPGTKVHVAALLQKDQRKGDYFFILFIFYVLYSTLLHLPPLRYHRADGSNQGPLQLVHWRSDALTTRLDLIQTSLDLIQH